jgi:hypothetical protein
MRIADVVAKLALLRPILAATVIPAVAAGCYPDDILATRVDGGTEVNQDCLLVLSSAVAASMGTRCGPLPAPTGPVICVGPAQADQLAGIVAAAPSGTSILLADGTYRMTGDETARSLSFRTAGVTLRSASGRRDRVILDGEYVTQEMVRIFASDIVVADLTLEHALHHAIHMAATASGSITDVKLRGLAITDCGSQLVKIDAITGPPDTYVDRGSLECSTLELGAEGRAHIQPSNVECATSGINASQVRGWSVRDSTFRGLYCPTGGVAQHAVHFGAGSRDTMIERNVIVDCARGVGFGSEGDASSRRYSDDPYPGIEPIGHYDGIIRNNFIFASAPQFDTGIELVQARGSKIFHNSIFHPTAAYSSLDYRFANTLVDVRNNLVIRITVRDQGQANQSNNLEGITGDLFAGVATGDLHLASTAATAIDQGVVLVDAGEDIDGFPHAVGAPDIGADELGAP